MERAASILASAERPLIIARANGRVAANAAALAEFAERFAFPAVEFRALANSLPSDHPMLLGYDPVPSLGRGRCHPLRRMRRAVGSATPRCADVGLPGDPAGVDPLF